MKIIMIALLSIILVSSFGLNASADDQSSAGAESKDTPTATPEDGSRTSKSLLTFGIYGTAYNTYNRGNLDDWFAELRVRAFSGAEQGDTTFWLQKDDYVQLSVSRYF